MTKVVAFLILVTSFGVTATYGLQMIENADILFRRSFEERDYKLQETWSDLIAILEMKNEEYITSGEYLKHAYTFAEIRNMSELDKEREVKRQLSSYRSAIRRISEVEHVYYYASTKETVIANIEWPLEREYKSYISFEGDCVTTTFPFYHGENTVADKIFVAYDNEHAEELRQAFETEKTKVYNEMQWVLLLMIPGLIALICIIWLSGGSLVIDRLWNEAIILLILWVVWIYFMVCASVNWISLPVSWVVGIVSGIFCLSGTALLLMLVRNIKNGRLIKGSLTYQVFAWFGRVFRDLMHLLTLNIKLSGAALGGMMITAITGIFWVGSNGGAEFFILLVIEAIAILWLILKRIMRPYDEEVAARLKVEVDAKMKSERLKAELITNVSHDLKTPLTAILNYSDLLLKRNPKDEYAQIIHDKGQKLRALTEDLFEVSKAQSGNMKVNMETLDLAELIDQTLAELDENEVDFKINLKERAIVADGTLMARVFGNLVGNIVKYSLAGTRAYIDSFEYGGKTAITFKNIANYQMNFDSDEIAERFKRGDSSRATEGNGLGLAISKSYTEACNGQFDIEVDGDLFKVTILI